MRNFFKLIWKINAILILLLALILIITQFEYLLRQLPKTRPESYRIPIISEEKIIKKYEIYEYSKIKEINIFVIFSNAISGYKIEIEKSNSRNRSSHGNFYSLLPPKDQSMFPVNIIFSNSSKNEKLKLFESDVYIVYYELASLNKKDQDQLSKNVYLIIKNDTNNNGFLDMEDKKWLLISNYNGKNLKLLTDNMIGFSIVGNNKINYRYLDNDDNEILGVFDVNKDVTTDVISTSEIYELLK